MNCYFELLINDAHLTDSYEFWIIRTIFPVPCVSDLSGVDCIYKLFKNIK